MKLSRKVALLLAAGAVLLSGCASTVSLEAAPEAADPRCAEASVRVPDDIGGTELLRYTDAQATAAWGEPTVALLYCGVPVPEVSDIDCIDYQGVFWLREVVDAGYAFTTYGRDPALRIVIDDEIVGGPGVALDEITSAVSYLPENGRVCLSTDDTVTPSD